MIWTWMLYICAVGYPCEVSQAMVTWPTHAACTRAYEEFKSNKIAALTHPQVGNIERSRIFVTGLCFQLPR